MSEELSNLDAVAQAELVRAGKASPLDLVDAAIKLARETAMGKVRHRAEDAAEDRILDVLLPSAQGSPEDSGDSETRQKFRKRLREGTLDDKEIEIDVSVTPVGVEIMSPPGMEEMASQLQGLFHPVEVVPAEVHLKMKISGIQVFPNNWLIKGPTAALPCSSTSLIVCEPTTPISAAPINASMSPRFWMPKPTARGSEVA